MEAVVLEESLSPYALRPRTFRELSLITAAKAERANKAAPAKKATTTAAFITGEGAVPVALFSFGGNTTTPPAVNTSDYHAQC